MDTVSNSNVSTCTLLILNCLHNTTDNFVAGKISQYSETWKTITSDRNLLNIVCQGYHLEFECEPCGTCSRKEIKFNESEQIVIDNLLTKFLHKKVIEPVIHQYGEVLSSIFIRPKADGSFRLILNLSNLNEHLEYKHFKMETFKSALELVKNKNFFAKLDIKDAYYSLGIKKEDSKFLRFTWKGQLYQFTAMPNGLSPAPRIFTKLLKPVLSSLRKEGYVNCAYIDDILLVGDTYEECLNNVQETMKLFDSLGFTIHKEKSVVVPAQNIEFLGFSIDSVSMVVKLAPKKVANIVELCRTLLRKCFVTIREFAQLIGKLVASEHGVLYAPVFYKTLEIQKDVELKLNKGNFDAKIILSNESKQCINWWIENIHNSYKPIVFKPPDRKIESDSSMLGYGALDVTNNLTLSGVWSLSERNKHINFLELKAAFLALKAFCCRTCNEHVQLFLDNTTAIKYLNKMGGRKEELNNLAKEIWLWCIHRQIWLSVFHIPGKLNIKADALSRHKSNSDMEWMIIDSIFECIMNKLGPCDIDLFASKHNNRLEQYCDQCSVTENLSGKSNRISHSTFIFNTALVSAATTNDLRSTIYFAKSGNDSDESQNKSNSSFEKHEIGGFQDLRNKMCEGGVSAEAADIIINSWRDSTKKQYGTYIKKWLLFCDKEKTDRFDPSVNSVLKFLLELHLNGLGYSAVNTAKSAVSSFVYLITNVQIGKHFHVKQFMKGIFNKKPVLPRYNCTWNVEMVLSLLKTWNKDITLKNITFKLAMLLALTTGQRMQSIFLIDIRNLELDTYSVKIRYGDLLKQTRPGYQLPEIFIEAFKPDYRICVVHTLHEYLERTNKLRLNNTQLFLSFQKPYKPVKKGTIAKWIKQVLIMAGIDMTIFTPHSTRGAATSYVSGRIPIATILRTAGWRKDSVFRKFYQRPITNDSSFSYEILLAKRK
ncbi:uncharacterized protein [Mytilus edulis]|uniref:uncharacterized protein n=1 Tax=Mytilus edulis TaxID=6550 RepID=UPI0039EECA22